MGINAVSATSTYAGSYTNEAANIQKQITRLQGLVSELQSNTDMDEDTKSQQLTVYQTQISQLQVQLSNVQKGGQPAPAAESEVAEVVQQQEALSEAKEDDQTGVNRAIGLMGTGQYVDYDI